MATTSSGTPYEVPQERGSAHVIFRQRHWH
jgi:hypothetical protein